MAQATTNMIQDVKSMACSISKSTFSVSANAMMTPKMPLDEWISNLYTIKWALAFVCFSFFFFIFFLVTCAKLITQLFESKLDSSFVLHLQDSH